MQTVMTRKDMAMAFLRLAASGRAREAFREYVGDGLRHHNPYFEGDAKSLMSAMDKNAELNPQKTLDIKQALEDGDLVAVHSHVRMKPSDRGVAVVHLFRFVAEHIVEMWDVGQEIPATSPNGNGMF